MGVFDNFPYTNVHDLNTDWLVKTVKEVKDKTDEIDQAVINAKNSEDNAKQSEENAHRDALDVADALETFNTSLTQWNNDSRLIVSQLEQNTTDIGVNSSRIDAIISGTTPDANAELIDIRVSYDGVTYSTAGDAVRQQITDLVNATLQTDECLQITDNSFVGGADGIIVGSQNDYVASDYMDIEKHLDNHYIFFDCYLRSWMGFAFYDKTKTYITGIYGNIATTYGYTNAALNHIKIAIPANAKYLRITRRKDDGYTQPSDIKITYFKTKYSDTEISNVVKNTEIEMPYDAVIENGHYIGDTGAFNSNIDFSVIDPILVPAGYKITFEGSGSNTNVAMISSYAGGTYTPLVISRSGNVETYEYTTSSEIYAVFSFRTRLGYTLKITNTLENTIQNLKNTEDRSVSIDYTTILKNMAGIGDSLMSGEIYDDDNNYHADCYNYSWLAQLSTFNNAQWECFSQGGLTTKGWLESHWKTDFENLLELPDSVFIALGSNDKNDQLTIPKGTPADPSSSSTFCGYYKRIIELAHTKCPNAKIYCCSLYTTATLEREYSQMIETITSQYAYAYFINIADNISINVKTNSVYAENSHFSTIGYILVANLIHDLVNKSINNNLADYKYFGLYNNR